MLRSLIFYLKREYKINYIKVARGGVIKFQVPKNLSYLYVAPNINRKIKSGGKKRHEFYSEEFMVEFCYKTSHLDYGNGGKSLNVGHFIPPL